MAEKITDPNVIEQFDAAPASKPKQITDPKLAREFEGLGEEPSRTERVVEGFTDPVRASLQYAEKIMPGLHPSQPSSAMATPAENKLPQKKRDEGFDPWRFAGNMANPGPFLATGAALKLGGKLGPYVAGPVGGVAAALTEPVPEGTKDFWGYKGKQVTEGLGLGIAFTFAGKAASEGMQSIGNYLAKWFPEGVMDKAVTAVLARISQGERHGGIGATDALDLIEAANKGTVPGAHPGINVNTGQPKPMRVADIGVLSEEQPLRTGQTYSPNQGIAELAREVAGSGGEATRIARRELRNRDTGSITTGQPGAFERVQAEISDLITSGPSAFQATELLLQSRSAAAKPLWKEADKIDFTKAPIESLKRLDEFLASNDIKEGLRRGYKIEGRNALAEGEPFSPDLLGITFNQAGDPVFTRTPNMRVLQMAKEGLDDMIAESRDQFGRLSKDGRSIDNVRRSYLNLLDSMDPTGAYAKARASWAGHSANMDAIALGKKLFSMSLDEPQSVFSKLSPGEQEFFRIGVADTMREKLLKSGITSDEAKTILKNDNGWTRRQLEPIFKSSKDFNQFVDSVNQEATMFRAKNEYTGSKSILAQGQNSVMDMVKARFFYMMNDISHPLRAVANFYRMHRDLGMKSDPKLNEALAKVLFTEEGPALLRNPPPAPTLSEGKRSVIRMSTEGTAPFLATAAEEANEQRKRNRVPDIQSRATGGPVEAGQPYMVGERGPEIVVPSQDGEVVTFDPKPDVPAPPIQPPQWPPHPLRPGTHLAGDIQLTPQSRINEGFKDVNKAIQSGTFDPVGSNAAVGHILPGGGPTPAQRIEQERNLSPEMLDQQARELLKQQKKRQPANQPDWERTLRSEGGQPMLSDVLAMEEGSPFEVAGDVIKGPPRLTPMDKALDDVQRLLNQTIKDREQKHPPGLVPANQNYKLSKIKKLLEELQNENS